MNRLYMQDVPKKVSHFKTEIILEKLGKKISLNVYVILKYIKQSKHREACTV